MRMESTTDPCRDPQTPSANHPAIGARSRWFLVAAAGLLVAGAGSHAQEADTLGVLVHEPGADPGYTLIDSLNGGGTYLIDNDGRIINDWSSEFLPGNMAYLIDDGSLLRASDPGPLNGTEIIQPGDGGLIEQISWEGELLWSFVYNDPEARQHHDIEPMPNGNVLILAWEYHTLEEAFAKGRDPETIATDVTHLLAERIVEVRPTGPTTAEVVWQWSSWDHHVQDHDPTAPNYGTPADHPGRIDFNAIDAVRADWIHANSIDYNEELDQIVISTPYLHELWIIDHGTTTEEAAGPAGDLLYRWGNPQMYGRGGPEDQILYGNHDALWIREGTPGAGNLTIFNNGKDRPEGAISTIEELTPPLQEDGTYALVDGEAWTPHRTTTVFEYDPPEAFFSRFISGGMRLPNGNLLACSGCFGRVVEQTPAGDVVWEYHSPLTQDGRLFQGELPGQNYWTTDNKIFRAVRYAPDHPGLVGRDLTPGPFLERYPCPGDLDGDGEVGGADLTQLLAEWGCSGEACLPDLNGDGTVGGPDLTIILSAWGGCL